MKLFGTSGVRGVWNQFIGPQLFMKLGLCVATYLGNEGEIVVGRDCRTTGEVLESAFISGLLEGGCTPVKVGIAPTPVVAFSVRLLDAKAGGIITASHNPPEYNGLKLWSQEGTALLPEEEEKIEEIFKKEIYQQKVSWKEIRRCLEIDTIPLYTRQIKRKMKLESGFKVVVDCGNGAASLISPQLLRDLGCKVITVNSDPSSFPGRELEPTPSSLDQLRSLVISSHADLGIAHDGDADRMVAVDDQGRVARPDDLLALFVQFLAKSGDKVVTTVDASSVIDAKAGEKKVQVVRTKVGDVHVARACKRENAILGGEPCGTLIYPPIHLAPDGIIAAILLLKMLEDARKPLSALIDNLPKFFISRDKVPCPQGRKERVMSRFLQEAQKLGGISTVDGVRIEFEEGWALVRPSGTEPFIRVTVEGRSEDWVNRTVKLVKSKIENIR